MKKSGTSILIALSKAAKKPPEGPMGKMISKDMESMLNEEDDASFEDSEEMDEYEMAAQEIIDAVQDGDAKAVSEALRSFIELCTM